MKTKNVRFILPLLLVLGTAFMLSACDTESRHGRSARFIPVQHNGRVKSFEAFSRQVLSYVTERETWNRKPAYVVMLESMSDPNAFRKNPWIRIGYRELVSYLGLPEDRQFFSYEELLPSADRIESLARSSQAKRDQDVRPTKLEQKGEALYSHMLEVKQLIAGETFKLIPVTGQQDWVSPYLVSGARSDEFKNMIRSFHEGRYGDFEEHARSWTNRVHEETALKYYRKIRWEVLYYDWRPFQWAWMLYLAAFLVIAFRKRAKFLGAMLLSAAFSLHTMGLLLRVLILSRPPVSNMYESMIFMNWVLMAAALVFSMVRRNLTVAGVGAFISALVMIYADLLPIDPSLEVLVPVLRSNYWLTIHVMTIVSSYGIFGLAMGLGHRHLILDWRKKLPKKEAEQSAQLIHRVIQVGVLLLGIGTVLGGVWANESWGRFWGWDPKETWALITFLGYLIVVHLRYAKILTAFGIALSAVLGFLLVLMTWYGVNFVLGRGLHSYGQGSGGMGWVILYLALEAAFVAAVLLKKYSRPRKKA